MARDAAETVSVDNRSYLLIGNLTFDGHLIQLSDVDLLVWDSNSSDNMNMMVDEDYMGLMSDTLFSTITNQPFVFPDSREIGNVHNR